MSTSLKSAIGLIIITILSKILGFAREIVLSYIYGASSVSDVYLISMSIPTVIFGAIGAALATTFIPIYFEVENQEDNDRALKFANNVFNIVITLTIILAVLGFIFTKPLVKIFAMEFSGEKLALAVQFTKIMIFSVVFIGLNSILTSWLQIKENFIIPGMVGFVNNTVLITAIIISSKGNVYLLAIGTVIGLGCQVLFQLPFAIKNGYRYKLHINLKDKYIKKMLWLVVPIFISSLVSQLNFVIDKSLASNFGDGIIVILNNGSKLIGIINGLFIGAIGAVIYPMLSKLSNEENKENFSNIVVKSINSIIIITIPIMVGAVILSRPIIKLVFERGAFDATATSMTAVSFSIYALAMIAFALNDILGKVFYSLKDTKTPMINGTIAVILNIILNILLSKLIGYAGLALATSISSILCILLLFRNLGKKMGYYGQDKITITLTKSTISALIMGVVTYFVYKFLGITIGLGTIKEAITLILSVGIGAIVYGILVILLKIEEVDIILNMIKSKTKKINYKKSEA